MMKNIIVTLIFTATLTFSVSAKEKCDRSWKLGDPLIGPCKYDAKTKKLKLPNSETASNIGEKVTDIGNKAKSTGKKILGKLNTDSKLTDMLFKKK
tara:strand:- start:25 stop:312 length:288 start_codon:yes stop_codon:yes gene_type:complete